MKVAKYKCLRCGFCWEQLPAQVICPKCRYLYIKWLNYKELFENGNV